MTLTSPPRPYDLEFLPALTGLARPATRLHPCRGRPGVHDSSVAGPLLCPAEEPWPVCARKHEDVSDEPFAGRTCVLGCVHDHSHPGHLGVHRLAGSRRPAETVRAAMLRLDSASPSFLKIVTERGDDDGLDIVLIGEPTEHSDLRNPRSWPYCSTIAAAPPSSQASSRSLSSGHRMRFAAGTSSVMRSASASSADHSPAGQIRSPTMARRHQGLRSANTRRSRGRSRMFGVS